MNPKIKSLYDLFSSSDKVLVAFSGGVDSSFLIYILNNFEGLKAGAVTVKTPYIPDWELEEAVAFCKAHNIDHSIIELGIPDNILNNPDDRCYRCKKELFGQILEFSRAGGYNIVADGTNVDDSGLHRPGMKALDELGISSPLKEAGMSKEDIRELSGIYGLKTWNKPSYACLLTRLPYNREVKAETLKQIELGELIIHNMGFKGARLRYHNPIARIECFPSQIEELIGNREIISEKLHDLGFRYVTIDLDGYRTGSMDNKS